MASNGFFLPVAGVAGVEKDVAGVEKVWRAVGKVGEVGDHPWPVTGRIFNPTSFTLCFSTQASLTGYFVNFLWHFMAVF